MNILRAGQTPFRCRMMHQRVGQDQVYVEFFGVLSTRIWIQVKGKDKVCCLKHFGEYAEAYQKAKSLVRKPFFSHQPQKVSKKPLFSVISLHSEF